MDCFEIPSSMTLHDYIVAISAPVRLSDATALFAIGISLYLALGIVQVASSVGISSLRRKAETYRLYVVKNHRTDKYARSRDLFSEVHAAEIDADGVNRVILVIVCVCLALGVPYFVWAIFARNLWITGTQLALLTLGYIGLPVALLVAALVGVRRKSKTAREAVDAAFRDL